jgi:hypothetical protein
MPEFTSDYAPCRYLLLKRLREPAESSFSQGRGRLARPCCSSRSPLSLAMPQSTLLGMNQTRRFPEFGSVVDLTPKAALAARLARIAEDYPFEETHWNRSTRRQPFGDLSMAQPEGGVARLRCLHNEETARLVFVDIAGYRGTGQSGDGDEAAEQCACRCQGHLPQNRRTSRSFQTR